MVAVAEAHFIWATFAERAIALWKVEVAQQDKNYMVVQLQNSNCCPKRLEYIYTSVCKISDCFPNACTHISRKFTAS